MDDKILYAIGGFVFLVIIISLAGMASYTGELPVTAKGYLAMEPTVHNMGPGDMIAIVLTIENNLADSNETLYYNFAFEPIRTDSGTPTKEFGEWVLMDNDYIELRNDEYAFKDAVISVPEYTALGEHIFHIYACYASSPDELSECGRSSSNIWAGPLTLSIIVRD